MRFVEIVAAHLNIFSDSFPQINNLPCTMTPQYENCDEVLSIKAVNIGVRYSREGQVVSFIYTFVKALSKGLSKII